jgi:hypothetical protein
MNQITLKNDGRIAENSNIITGSPLMFLGHKVTLDEKYTLRSFFQMLKRYSLLAELNPFLPDCIGQYKASPRRNCVTDDIDRLEFNKTVEMIGFPGNPRLEIYNALCGYLGKDKCEIKSFRLENLLDMPLELGMLKHVIFGDKVDVFEFETVFSLFEFIDGIVWELSFQGIPQECAI